MTPQGWVDFRAKLDGAPTGLCIAPSWSGCRLRADAPCVHPRASRLPWPWPLSRRSAGRAPGEPHGVSAVWAWGHRRPGLLGFQAVAMGSMFLCPQMAFPVATRAAFLKGRLTGFENRFPVPRLSRAALHVRLRHRCDPLCSPFPSRVGPHMAPGLRTRQTKPTKVPELLGPPARPSPGAAEPDGPSAEAPRAGGGPSPRPPPRVPRAPLRSLPRPGSLPSGPVSVPSTAPSAFPSRTEPSIILLSRTKPAVRALPARKGRSLVNAHNLILVHFYLSNLSEVMKFVSDSLVHKLVWIRS